jgi:DeoR/GlpR family transcriptional regulator of sugar metabolism
MPENAADTRQVSILEVVASTGAATTRELSAHFGVSEMTVRRDLQTLEDRGLVRRIPGGATVPSSPSERSFRERLGVRLSEKRAIGRTASALIKDGDTVVLDGGTTTLEIARQLTGRVELTVITNSLRVLDALAGSPQIRVIATGGSLKHRELVLVGPMAQRMLSEMRADLAFISSAGVVPTDGPMDFEDMEVAVKRAMIGTAAKCYVVADSSKFGVVRPMLIAPMATFLGVITDEGLPRSAAADLRRAGLEVRVGSLPALGMRKSHDVLRDDDGLSGGVQGSMSAAGRS